MDTRDVIALGRRIAAFLADPQVQAFFAGLDQAAFERFKAADTESARLNAWAFSQALDELKAAFQGAVEAGDHAASVNPGL